MKRVATLALAPVLLTGCSLLFDPDDLTSGGGGDSGSGDAGSMDARTADGGGMDASREDAPRPDAVGADVPGIDAGRGAVPCETGRWALSGAAGVPSITLRADAAGPGTVDALVAFVDAAARGVLATLPLDGDARGTSETTFIVEGIELEAIAIRDTADGLAYAFVTAAAPMGGTQVWVYDLVAADTINLGGPNPNDQAGPVAVTGSPVRYVWNELVPNRQGGSLLATDTSAETGYNYLRVAELPTPALLAASDGALVILEATDPRDVLLWNGDGGGTESSATPHSLRFLGNGRVGPPAIAWRGGDEYVVVGWDAMDELELVPVTCSPTGLATTCSPRATIDAATSLRPPQLLDAVGLGTDGMAVVHNDGDETTLILYDTMLSRIGSPIPIGSLAGGGLDVAAVEVGGSWHIVIAEIDGSGALHVTDYCAGP